MREGLVQLINQEQDLAICGEARDGCEGVEMAVTLRPDLILADLTLPKQGGVELIKEIRAKDPDAAVLVLSMHEETIFAERALRAGARGYIMKDEGAQKLMQAIRQVLAGHAYVSDQVSAKILDLVSGKQSEISPVERLTDREFQIFQMLGTGKSTRMIAEELKLSTKTVEVHRAHIKEKLQLASAAELISFAARWLETHQ